MKYTNLKNYDEDDIELLDIGEDIVDIQDIQDIPTESMIDSIVPTTDNKNAPSLTPRVLLIGSIWCILLGSVNAILAFRTTTFQIPSFLATLLSYPLGIFLAKVVPKKTIDIMGYNLELNHGPFGIKEHVLITIIASAGGKLAYGIDNVVAQKSKLFMVPCS